MKIANCITLFVTIEFDGPVDPDEVRKEVDSKLDWLSSDPDEKWNLLEESQLISVSLAE